MALDREERITARHQGDVISAVIQVPTKRLWEGFGMEALVLFGSSPWRSDLAGRPTRFSVPGHPCLPIAPRRVSRLLHKPAFVVTQPAHCLCQFRPWSAPTRLR